MKVNLLHSPMFVIIIRKKKNQELGPRVLCASTTANVKGKYSSLGSLPAAAINYHHIYEPFK